ISPLLSNIMLHELDKELERRGHRYVRFADDFSIYTKSKKSARRAMKKIKPHHSISIKQIFLTATEGPVQHWLHAGPFRHHEAQAESRARVSIRGFLSRTERKAHGFEGLWGRIGFFYRMMLTCRKLPQ
ncbi:MAG: reverse transcriptase domain-containing protein, partial [Cyclobacteriaceae bacterium]